MLENLQEDPIILKDTPATAELTACESCLFYGLNFFFCMLFAFLPCCCGFYAVEPLEATVILAFGKIIKVEKEPGLHWFYPMLSTRRVQSLAVQTIRV